MSDKICPLLDRNCEKEKCQLYIRDKCALTSIADSLRKMNKKDSRE